MDDLDRLYRRLVHNIRATRPEYLQIPFTVRELYEQLVPYRHNRRELSIDTNDDYETAVARLLSGERGYLQADPEMQDALRRELASPTGDPGLFKEHGDTVISLTADANEVTTPIPAPATVAAPGATESEPESESVNAAYDAIAPAVAIPDAAQAPVPSLLSSLSHIDVPTGCRFCGGTLPEGREANYCPHCGENLRTKRCPACGAEMDTSWKFCVSCGRKGE